MPKDSKKNRYVQVGITRDSWTLAKLEEDAERHQMQDYLPKLIVLRLTEYYRLVEKGFILPGAMAQLQVPAREASSANGHMMTSQRGAALAPSPPASTVIAESDRADENADEALNFFKMDD